MTRISDPRLLQLLEAQAMSADVVEAAIADNCRFDERASKQRWLDFQGRLPVVGPLCLADLGRADDKYRKDLIEVSSTSVPDSFLAANAPALLKNLEPDQVLVRLEVLERPLNKVPNAPDMEMLAEWLKHPQHPEHADAFAEFMDGWALLRDNRPTFATFHDEVCAEVESDDWPHLLRDRLGLGFYPKKTRIPVALMRYSLKEVIQAVKRDKRPAAPCALPTVLDGGMHEYFYPAPERRQYGATLHLAEDMADLLTAEILHFRIQYQPRHLWKLGWIEQPHRFSTPSTKDELLRQARDLHLMQLRIESEREDFAAEMEGRT